MEKILLLVDQKGHDKSSFDISCFLAKITNSTLTALFLDPEPARSRKDLKKMYDKLYPELTSIVEDLPEEHWKSQLGENKRSFALACSEHNIRWADQVGPVFSLEQIIHETRFADLLVLHPETHFEKDDDSVPTETVREILGHAECPVVVAPQRFSGIAEILFAYDGTPSAVLAVKQFTYLFPALSTKKLVCLEISENKESKITDQQSLGQYLELHYAAIDYRFLHGDPSKVLITYLAGKKEVFVVAGAYGRSMISSLIKPSTAESLLQPANVPVFIAHR